METKDDGQPVASSEGMSVRAQRDDPEGFVAVARELLEIAKRLARTGECTCHDLPDTEFCDVCHAKAVVKKAGELKRRWFPARTG